MYSKVAFGLVVVLASASVSMAATTQPRTDSRKIYRPAPPVTNPVENCDAVRVHFPTCSGGSGGGM